MSRICSQETESFFEFFVNAVGQPFLSNQEAFTCPKLWHGELSYPQLGLRHCRTLCSGLRRSLHRLRAPSFANFQPRTKLVPGRCWARVGPPVVRLRWCKTLDRRLH